MKNHLRGAPGALKFVAISTSLLSIVAATAVSAAETEAPTDEIIVTAERGAARNLQDVPIAVTAITPDRLDRTASFSLADLTRYTPALNIVEAGPGINKIEIRGLTTGQLVPNSTSDVQDRSLVAVYLDDAVISLQGQNPDLKVIDLERVEVLRGPQGTLYGAGSMTGTIRYITAKPDPSKSFGTAEGILSQTEKSGSPNGAVRAMLNLPLVTDKLALRLTGYYGHDAGFIDNIGAQNKRDANSVDTVQVRAALRWQAGDDTNVDLSYTYLDLAAHGLYRGFAGLPDYTFSGNGPEHNYDKFHLVNLTIAHDFGPVSLVSSTSYTHRDLDFLESLEPTVAYFFQFAAPGPNNPFNVNGTFAPPNPYNQALVNQLPVESYSIKNRIDDWQQEIRLSSDQSGRLRATGGFFFQSQRRRYVQDIPLPGFDTLSYVAQGWNADPANAGNPYNSQTTHGAFSPNNVFAGLQNIDEYQVAGFGEVTFDVTPRLSLTAGLRGFFWHQDFDLYFGGIYGVDTIGPRANQPITVKDSREASGVNPRFVASWKATDDLLVFFEAAKGFRYGGVNQPIPRSAICDQELASVGGTAPGTFGPDSLWTYSVGEKARLFDKRLTVNATAFYIDWSQVQNRVVLPQCAYYYIQNNGQVRSVGAELEIAARVTDELTLTFAGSYTDAKTEIDVPGAQARAGDKVPNFPDTVVGIGAIYDRPVGSGVVHFTANWQYRAPYGNLYNQNGDPTSGTSNAFNYRRIAPQDTLNLGLAYSFGRWEAGVFGTNLTNGTKITNVIPRAAYVGNWQAGDYLTYARPRTIGVRVKAGF
ncbi:hypothetical protein IP88_09145 [alpha proteobacterium AAP81b]|nr:hypothetical protein IP88_09145 [alpha proteobacterium AAP81b]